MAFNKEQIQKVWEKAKIVEGYDETRYRKDACGAWIIRNRYGDTDSLYGWVIDHVVPQSLLIEKGFSQAMIDNLQNLRAMQHDNNTSKSNDYPSYTAVVTSEGAENVNKWKFLEVNSKKQEELNKLYGI